jgi:hypothetical protein
MPRKTKAAARRKARQDGMTNSTVERRETAARKLAAQHPEATGEPIKCASPPCYLPEIED